MAVDIIIVASILTTVIAGLGAFIARLHIKKCSAGCIKSDCMTPPNSPSPSLHTEDTKSPVRGLTKVFRIAKKLNELEETSKNKEVKEETSI
jgi:hypothetical protein